MIESSTFGCDQGRQGVVASCRPAGVALSEDVQQQRANCCT